MLPRPDPAGHLLQVPGPEPWRVEVSAPSTISRSMSRGRGPRPCPDPLTVQLVTTLQLVTQVWLECPASWVSAKDVRWPCEMSTARKHGPLRGADTCAAISTGQDRGNIQASVSIGHLQRPAQVNDLTRTATEGPRCSGSRAGGPARRPV